MPDKGLLFIIKLSFMILKQCVGIDISKGSFTACISKFMDDISITVSEVKNFSNDQTGFNSLTKWMKKNTESSLPLIYCMEATGTYYENLAYHLYMKNQDVCVVLPNKVKHFGQSLNVKTKTDLIDAITISKMGVQMQLQLWHPPQPAFKKLRASTRLLNSLSDDKTMISNRLEAANCGYDPDKMMTKTYKDLIKTIDKKIDLVEKHINKILKSNTQLWSKVETLLTIPGVGIKTVATILGETQGFKLIKNQRQLVSYAGLDVVQNQSGTSVNGRSRISKKGNSQIRRGLYMPAMSAIKHNKPLSETYNRINSRNTSKKIGLIAVSRKLLVLIYSMWKSGKAFDQDYNKQKISGFQEAVEPSSCQHEVLS